MNMDFTDTELRRIEEISQNASRPERGAMVDGWSVGLSPSKAKRSRSVNAFYSGVRSFEENLAEVRALYRVAKLPCIFRVSRFVADSSLDKKLAAMGCEVFDKTFVQTLRLNDQLQQAVSAKNSFSDYSVKILYSPSEIGQIVQVLRGDSDREIGALVARWQNLPLDIAAFAAYENASGDAVSHVLTIREGDTVGVFDVITRASHRGRGLASELIIRALANAQAQGAKNAYLQVMQSNPAASVYERLGFRVAYEYWHRTVPETL